MDKQLGLFDDAGHYFVSIDAKKYDFVIYNRDAFEWNNEEIKDEDLVPLKYKEATPVIK